MPASGSRRLYAYHHVPALANLVGPQGIDVTELLREVGLPTDTRNLAAPLPQVRELVALVARRSGRSHLGLELATSMKAGTFGVTEFLVRTAPSVERGLAIVGELSALLNAMDLFRYEATDRGGTFHYSVAGERDGAGMHHNEMAIAYLVTQLGGAIGRPLAPTEVWFAHARSDGAMEVARFFGCSVRFQAADSGFALTRETLAAVPRSADPLIFEFLHAQARARLDEASTPDVVAETVRVIESQLANGDVRVETVAAVLGVSARTLQRDLEAAETSYRDLLAQARRRRRDVLEKRISNKAELARLLGFSDARAMRRSLDDAS